MRRMNVYAIGVLSAVLIKVFVWAIVGMFSNYSTTPTEKPLLKSLINFGNETSKYDITKF